MGLRLTTGPAERRDKHWMRLPIGRIDRDRPAGPFDRLFVLLKPEMGGRLARVPVMQRWIVRTEPNGLVKILKALFKLPELQVVKGQLRVGVHGGRIQIKRALGLRVGLLQTPLVSEYLGLEDVPVGECWIEGEHFRHQFVAPLEIGLRGGAEVVRDRLPVLDRQKGQGINIVGIDGERLFAETETRLRLLADSFWGS